MKKILERVFSFIKSGPLWLKVLVLALVAVGAMLGGRLLVYALTASDDFSTANYVADTWHTTVDTSAGVARLAERSCDSANWHCAANSICPNLFGDGDYIIVASTTLAGDVTRVWKSTATNCDRPQCGQDGGQNGDNLVADNTVNFGYYLARDYCKAAGGRLPTLDELGCIYTNRASFGDNFQSALYWSATEYLTGTAWAIHFTDGSQDDDYKNYAYYVRCVTGW